MRQFALALVLLLACAAASFAADPKVGDPAPEFSLSGSDGRTYTLVGLLAQNDGVVLAFFPKAFTPG